MAAPQRSAPDLEDLTFANIENSVLEMFDRQISTTGLSKVQREAVNGGLKRAAKQVTESLQVITALSIYLEITWFF